jgi:hypothetical protein
MGSVLQRLSDGSSRSTQWPLPRNTSNQSPWGMTSRMSGSPSSYDLHATKAGTILKVDVKGTTSNGSEIVLTRNEVELHQHDYPANALAIVHHIKLYRTKDAPPTASGGELILEMPWALKQDRLAPIAFRYTTDF